MFAMVICILCIAGLNLRNCCLTVLISTGALVLFRYHTLFYRVFSILMERQKD